MNINNPGILYIVPTPIGNIQDMSFRAVDTLKKVNYVAAEDTRHSAPLLRQFDIRTPCIAFHDHNEHELTNKLLKHLLEGESIALISDAGTPLISDPGYFLVKEARANGIKIVPLPGPCAAITALSAAGLPTNRFYFQGFLPAKTKARTDQLAALKNENATIIFYETPHRILDTLVDMQTVLGENRQVVIARELTKIFETIKSGSVSEIIEWMITDTNQQRGEFVVLVAGADKPELGSAAHDLLVLLLDHLPLKQAVELAVKLTEGKKNELYEMALLIKNESPE